MAEFGSVFKNGEKAVFLLRSLYSKYGYLQYKMSKFEEYDLYVGNKDFLVSENVITFTDTDGRLMALKPDVTLSIIKNSKDFSGVKKVYYDENVYRVSKGTNSFKEIMQVGLECLGDIDDYNILEVLSLAVESLKTVSENSVLDISHLGLVAGVIESANLSADGVKTVLDCIRNKNAHGIETVCINENVCKEKCELLKKLITVYGSAESMLLKLDGFINEKTAGAVEQLKTLCEELIDSGYGDKIRIDFSVVNDTNYYNGIVFKGFVDGIPAGILSGGQYDKLMSKMGRKEKAVGFAVYLDLLERFDEKGDKADVDVLIVYGRDVSVKELNRTVKTFVDEGFSVSAQPCVPDKLRYVKKIVLGKGV